MWNIMYCWPTRAILGFGFVSIKFSRTKVIVDESSLIPYGIIVSSSLSESNSMIMIII